MSKAVQFDSYGGVDVLPVRDVSRPVPGAGEVLVEVKAAGINPTEEVIRSGALHDLFPATFPSGQGSDLAGIVVEVPWEVAGSLFVAGGTAYAVVGAVRLGTRDTVAIAGAAGGVGSIAVQLARPAGATVLGIAGPSNDAWLAEHGAIPVHYGDALPNRLRSKVLRQVRLMSKAECLLV